MTEWYYSDAQRNQHGPVSAGDLATMHNKGLLPGDTLVWREGMADWKPWRDMIREVVAGDAAGDPEAEARAKAFEATVDDGAYRPYAVVERSPYAPPTAAVADTEAGYVAGGPVVYAGLWKRFAASFIDNFVTTALSYGMIFVLAMVMGAGAALSPNMGRESETMMLLVFGVFYPIMLLLPAVYFGWMQSSGTQASLGKMAIGIKVVRGDGRRIGFWRGFLRYVAYLLFVLLTCGLGVLISGLMAALTERKQALHDMICDTLVVDKYAYTANKEWQNEELGTVTIVILVIAGLMFLAIFALYAVMGAVMLGGMR